MKNRFLFTLAFVSLLTTSVVAQWINDILPHARTCNAITILNQQQVLLAGGNEYNDSILTVFRTEDQGNSWWSIIDQVHPWLKSISMGNTTTGYAVGYDGIIIKTTDGGNNWSALTLPGNAAFRQYNAVYFLSADTGYIAGGYKSNDSIQTILKTTDGGTNWSIQRDTFGQWLNAIYFTDALHGIAVGDSGVLLRTVDGGSNWNQVSLSGNLSSRNYNAITFLNPATGFIVGGHKTNDSIQTILKTTNGGSTWNIILDNPGYMLNGIDFSTATMAYAVGDRGTLLTTTDAGSTWSSINLPANVNDTMPLYCVNFINADFGMAGGKRGKVLIFKSTVPTVPEVTTLTATITGPTSAQLNATVNANNSPTGVHFEYGLTPGLGTTVIPSPDTVSGTGVHQVTFQLTGLLPNTFYYYKIVAGNNAGQITGDVEQFYTNDCEIPNCDFEVWDTNSYSKPIGWVFMGDVHRVVSYDGSIAAQLSDTGSTAQGGLILIGNPGEGGIFGGMPCPGRPDSVAYHIRYDIVTGDTAWLVMFFKLNGNLTDDVRIPITGSSGGNWENVVLPIQYSNGTVPDSLAIGFISTNILGPGKVGNPLSTLTIDNLFFPHSNINIPNGSFEQWDTIITSTVNGWYSNSYNDIINGPELIRKVTDRVSGQYAMRLSNLSKPGEVVTGTEDQQWNHPSFSVGGKHLTFNLYLKYLVNGPDTFTIGIQMFNSDTVIGYGNLSLDSPLLDYTPISLNIGYSPGSPIPDSADIWFVMTKNTGTIGSFAFIDNLSFDGFKPINTEINEVPKGTFYFDIYPNPAYSSAIVQFSETRDYAIDIFDVNVKNMYTGYGRSSRSTIDISQFANGIYLVKVSAGETTSLRKLVVIH